MTASAKSASAKTGSAKIDSVGTGPAKPALLLEARAAGYAIGAFNVVNLETSQAVVAAAEAERSAVILQISENAARHGGLQTLYGIARTLADNATVPVLLHFDHAETLVGARYAVELGFDSVMLESRWYDGHSGPREYARELRRLVDHAHPHGVAVEGEFEVVKKGERTAAIESIDNLPELIDVSGCDWVCVAIGSEHKMTAKAATLDLERLERIAAVVAQPLVLHGSSGVEDAQLAMAVSLGITKVNLATGLMTVFTSGVRAALAADPGLNDPRSYLAAGREAMTVRVREYLRLLRSAGRAG